jgi:protein SCO1/2
VSKNLQINNRILSSIILTILITSLIGISLYQNYSENQVNDLPVYNQINQFTLPSITGENFTYVPNENPVMIVSFMYTKCPGDSGCSLITQNMDILEDRLENSEFQDTTMLSIDFDYVNDTMTDLKNYATLFTNNFERWKFVLGNENQTNSVAEQFGFYFSINSDLQLSHGENDDDPYVHPMITYILDRDGYIRKLIQGTDWNFDQILNSINYLNSDNYN